MEIMVSCNTNNQGRIYTSILQGLSKTLVAEEYIEIHMFVCARQVKTVEDNKFQNKRKVRIVTIFPFSLNMASSAGHKKSLTTEDLGLKKTIPTKQLHFQSQQPKNLNKV